jgi:ribosomal protein S13
MKIIITEHQYRLLTEETSGIDAVLSKILDKFPQLEPHIDRIKSDIEKSDCQNIEFSNIKVHGILGMALHDKLVLSPRVLDKKLEDFIFVLFHEIAHEYQFKKYGARKMLDLYLGDVSDEDGARFMKNTEDVADEFGERKVREYVKLGILKKDALSIHGEHKNRPMQSYIQQVKQTKYMVKSQGFKTAEEASEFMYNFMVEKPTTKQEVTTISNVVRSSSPQIKDETKSKNNTQSSLIDDKGLDKIEKYIQNGSKGNLDLTPYYINSIGNLKTVGGDLDIVSSDIKSLGDLESVDGYLNLYDTKIDSFGKLKYVGKGLYINSTPLSKKYSEDEIRQMINVGGDIEM